MYCLNQWEKLEAFLQDGRLEIDNNRSERAIKPFVIGRKTGCSPIPRVVQRRVRSFTVS
nr:transposase [Collibacillus ludicampi]